MVSRLKLQYIKIVIATSMVWFLLDVVLLMYFTDCAMTTADCDRGNSGASGNKANSGGGGLLQKILPKDPDDIMLDLHVPVGPPAKPKLAPMKNIPKIPPRIPDQYSKPDEPENNKMMPSTMAKVDNYEAHRKEDPVIYVTPLADIAESVGTNKPAGYVDIKNLVDAVEGQVDRLPPTLRKHYNNLRGVIGEDKVDIKTKTKRKSTTINDKAKDGSLEVEAAKNVPVANKHSNLHSTFDNTVGCGQSGTSKVDGSSLEMQVNELRKIIVDLKIVVGQVANVTVNMVRGSPSENKMQVLAEGVDNTNKKKSPRKGATQENLSNISLDILNVLEIDVNDLNSKVDGGEQKLTINEEPSPAGLEDHTERYDTTTMDGLHYVGDDEPEAPPRPENEVEDVVIVFDPYKDVTIEAERRKLRIANLAALDQSNEISMSGIGEATDNEIISEDTVKSTAFVCKRNPRWWWSGEMTRRMTCKRSRRKGEAVTCLDTGTEGENCPSENGLMSKTPTGPGEMGKAVRVPSERDAEVKDKFKANQFNLVASEMMSVNRSLPDYRIPGCKNKKYPPNSHLPDTSVVIVFHNEAWSTLLRTVHSIINRSPPELLNEVILVDDASERDELGKPLDDYMGKLNVRVVIIRSQERTGLIRARLKGAEKAQGKVLTFLDAHCEATQGWLEPLMTEIHKDRTAVACPIIDVISDDTFEYITGSDMTWGGFNWKLNFRWYPVPQRELDRRGGDRSQPTKTPTMAGGLFSIDRDYFYEVGSYDEGMDIWGGENLEMSFRVWMCGGKVYIVTCSRVGHVFRKTSPYSWPGGVARIINHNTQRIVEVWMDEYKDFFYKINPGVKNTEYGDISARKEFREKHQCKSFKWYLENVYPESQMPVDFFALGEIKNKESGACIDSMGRKSGEKVGLVHCHGMGGNQVFSYTGKHSLQTDDVCLDVSAVGGPVKLFQCHGLGGNQNWQYDKEVFSYTGKKQLMMDENVCIDVAWGDTKFVTCDSDGPKWDYFKETLELRHLNSNQCLGKSPTHDRESPSIGPCDGSEGQKWMIAGMKF